MKRINAIVAETPDGTLHRSCTDCFCSNHNIDIEELKELDGQSVDGVVAFEVIEEDSKEDDTLIGRLCLDCRSPLADWLLCEVCNTLYWNGEGHLCDRSANPRLWRKVMNGLVSGDVEDFKDYTEDPIDM